MLGALDAMQAEGIPAEVIKGICDGVDINLYFAGSAVSEGAMYAVLIGAVAVFAAAYVLINALCKPRYGDR